MHPRAHALGSFIGLAGCLSSYGSAPPVSHTFTSQPSRPSRRSSEIASLERDLDAIAASQLVAMSESDGGLAAAATADLDRTLRQAGFVSAGPSFVVKEHEHWISAGPASQLIVERQGSRLELLPDRDFAVLDVGANQRSTEPLAGPAELASVTSSELLSGEMVVVRGPAKECVASPASCDAAIRSLARMAAARGARALFLVDAPPPRRLAGPRDAQPDPSPPPAPIWPWYLRRPPADRATLPLPVVLLTSRAADEILPDDATSAQLFTKTADQPGDRPLDLLLDLHIQVRSEDGSPLAIVASLAAVTRPVTQPFGPSVRLRLRAQLGTQGAVALEAALLAASSPTPRPLLEVELTEESSAGISLEDHAGHTLLSLPISREAGASDADLVARIMLATASPTSR